MKLSIIHSNTQRYIDGSFTILCRREFLLEIARQIDNYLRTVEAEDEIDLLEIHPFPKSSIATPAKSWDE